MIALNEGGRTRIRARRMGFVFQDFNLVPTLSARENMMLACDYAGKDGTQARAATLDALTLVGLAERVDHRPAELSGGEQQRVAIARALVNRPNLVLADEPTGNLDSEHAEGILSVLRLFNREQGLTVILVTHDGDVSRACDRTVSVRDGTIRAPAGEPHMPEARRVMVPVDAALEPVLIVASRG
jgi:putative ABC transport system ATP-binding protein